MDHEALLVDERLSAHGADVRFLSGVNSDMLHQHRLDDESLATGDTRIWAFSGVCPHVLSQRPFLTVRLAADVASMRLCSRMAHHMLQDLTLMDERLAAKRTRVHLHRRDTAVDFLVILQRPRRLEVPAADVTQVRPGDVITFL